MEKINSINELKLDDIILILDYMGQVRGMDKIQELDYETGKYEYLNQEGKLYQGNLNQYLDSAGVVYKVDENIYKYNNQNYDHAVISLFDVFENIYGENLGKFICNQLISMTRTDFKKRMDLMDFTDEFDDELHRIRFEDDILIAYRTKEEMNAAKKAIQDQLNQRSFFEFKM